jgi:hypothetical protein
MTANHFVDSCIGGTAMTRWQKVILAIAAVVVALGGAALFLEFVVFGGQWAK